MTAKLFAVFANFISTSRVNFQTSFMAPFFAFKAFKPIFIVRVFIVVIKITYATIIIGIHLFIFNAFGFFDVKVTRLHLEYFGLFTGWLGKFLDQL